MCPRDKVLLRCLCIPYDLSKLLAGLTVRFLADWLLGLAAKFLADWLLDLTEVADIRERETLTGVRGSG